MPAVRTLASYGVVNSPCTQAISNWAVEMSPFTDESRFTLFRPDGRRRVYQRRGERIADACVDERDTFGGGSVMV